MDEQKWGREKGEERERSRQEEKWGGDLKNKEKTRRMEGKIISLSCLKGMLKAKAFGYSNVNMIIRQSASVVIHTGACHVNGDFSTD